MYWWSLVFNLRLICKELHFSIGFYSRLSYLRISLIFLHLELADDLIKLCGIYWEEITRWILDQQCQMPQSSLLYEELFFFKLYIYILVYMVFQRVCSWSRFPCKTISTRMKKKQRYLNLMSSIFKFQWRLSFFVGPFETQAAIK